MNRDLPQTAPVDMAMPHMAEGLMTYSNWFLVTVMLIIALRYWRTSGSPIGVLLLLGGALTVLNEPIVDVLGKCWFPSVGSQVLLKAWGVSIPRYMLPTYAWYVGGQAFIAYRLFLRGISTRGVFGLYALYALVNAALEIPGLNLPQAMYSYYGNQPWVIAKFPIWWVFVNALMPISIGGIVFRLALTLRGWLQLMVVPVCWMTAGATNGAIGAPVWLALNLESGSIDIARFAAILSLGMGLLVCSALCMLVAEPSPSRSIPAASRRVPAIVDEST